MPLTDEEKKADLEVLKALDKAIEEGPWEHNLFFKGIGKKLRDLRDRFQTELGLEGFDAAATLEQSQTQSAQNEQIVYIALYQAEGTNLQKWGVLVNTLAGHNLTRPVYKKENEIQEMIRTKDFKVNDAYVAVKIHENDIMKPISEDKILRDKLGHELLTLKENVIRLENILYFTHSTGKYLLKNGVLSKEV